MKHIALVEDDPSMRSLLKIFLEMEQFKTILIDNFDSKSIIEILRSNHPDFLLMDVHLQGANGLELLSQIRRQSELRGIKVMMTSGEDCHEACLQAGANGFLLKPYMPTDLLNWLHAQG
jgi:DNA-binding response OmpR family regulator